MADTRIEDIRGTVDKQIAELRTQVATLTRKLSAQASHTAGQAGDVAEEARGRLRTAVASAREGGHNVVEAARENPGTAGSALLTAGLIGVAIGYLIGTSSHYEEPRRWHW